MWIVKWLQLSSFPSSVNLQFDIYPFTMIVGLSRLSTQHGQIDVECYMWKLKGTVVAYYKLHRLSIFLETLKKFSETVVPRPNTSGLACYSSVWLNSQARRVSTPARRVGFQLTKFAFGLIFPGSMNRLSDYLTPPWEP